MEQPKDKGQEIVKKSKEALICPLCRAPLVGEAIAAGKCQCCGHRFDPKDLKREDTSSSTSA